MMSKQQLNSIALQTGLNLYQQEKDYALKLFLFFYYKHFQDAVFKGGTLLSYFYHTDRFSEDLDFNIKQPTKFQEQVHSVIKQFEQLGITASFRKEELFTDAYTCEILFTGPLYKGTAQTQNKFSIDAGYRTGTLRKPVWKMIKSQYPETTEQFLAQTMDEQELFVEKLLALFGRKKGRDLYDIWFLLQAKIPFDKILFSKKSALEKMKPDKKNTPTKQEYERDMSRLTTKLIPYEQVKRDVQRFLDQATLTETKHLYTSGV